MKAFVFENGLERRVRVPEYDYFYTFMAGMALQKKCYLVELFNRRCAPQTLERVRNFVSSFTGQIHFNIDSVKLQFHCKFQQRTRFRIFFSYCFPCRVHNLATSGLLNKWLAEGMMEKDMRKLVGHPQAISHTAFMGEKESGTERA